MGWTINRYHLPLTSARNSTIRIGKTAVGCKSSCQRQPENSFFLRLLFCFISKQLKCLLPVKKNFFASEIIMPVGVILLPVFNAISNCGNSNFNHQKFGIASLPKILFSQGKPLFFKVLAEKFKILLSDYYFQRTFLFYDERNLTFAGVTPTDPQCVLKEKMYLCVHV